MLEPIPPEFRQMLRDASNVRSPSLTPGADSLSPTKASQEEESRGPSTAEKDDPLRRFYASLMQTVEKQSSITIQDDISHIKLRTSISSNLWTYGGLDGYSALAGEEKRWWKLSLILLDKETKPKQQWAQLKEWFRELFAEAYDDINAKEDSYDTVLQYLCTGNIREATLAASRLGDHATATMIPYPKTHSVQEQLKQQIAQWKADKSWSKRPASFRSIWRILTGDLKNALATLEHTTLRYHMIFGLFLFHGSNRSAEEPVDTLIRGYLSSRTREDDLREKEDPFRPYVEFIQWWWLTRYADAKKKYPPPRLIPQIVLAHCPISLGWRLTREYAFELGGAKNWTQRWSLHLVRMQLPRPALLAALFEPDAGHIIRLLSFVDCDHDTAVLRDIHLPESWLKKAKAAFARAQGDYIKAIELYRDVKEEDKATKIIFDDLVPTTLLQERESSVAIKYLDSVKGKRAADAQVITNAYHSCRKWAKEQHTMTESERNEIIKELEQVMERHNTALADSLNELIVCIRAIRLPNENTP